MTAKLETVAGFRGWATVNVPANVPDTLIQACLDEAEAGLVADVLCGTVDRIITNIDANPIGVGEVRRRAQNLLGRRNSPEGVAGVGQDGFVMIPASPPGSAIAVRQIKQHLGIPLVVVA